MQRLRHIHQLGMTYLVYPGATHRRFEHSLGVMELATRIFDTVTKPGNIRHGIIEQLVSDDLQHQCWKQTLRMAALCHDVGHLPFSHMAEKQLLPAGMTHEDLGAQIICSAELKPLWDELHVNPERVAKIALGPKPGTQFSSLEGILTDMITGPVFGADRMDYLIRDSHHAGVVYGRFDHLHLIDTIRVLDKCAGGSTEPTLGVEEGGIHAAEALLLARYFMYMQLYLHPVRRIYDIHLQEFMRAWFPAGLFSSAERLLSVTDNNVLVALADAATDRDNPANELARRITERRHYKRVYTRNPSDLRRNLEAATLVYRAVCEEFGDDNVRYDRFPAKEEEADFPVLMYDERVESARRLSHVLGELPEITTEFVFVAPHISKTVEDWLDANRERIIRQKKGASRRNGRARTSGSAPGSG